MATTITIQSQDDTKTPVTIDSKQSSDIQETIRANNPDSERNPKAIFFGKLDDADEVESTDYLVIQNQNKYAKLKNEELNKYTYFSGKDFLIIPLSKTVSKRDFEMLIEKRDSLGKLFFDNYQPKKKDMNFSIHYYPFKEAKFHQGIDFDIDEPQEYELPTVLEGGEIVNTAESLGLESDETFEDTNRNWEVDNDNPYVDATLEQADNFIKSKGGNVITMGNKVYIYTSKNGAWKTFNDKEMIQYLYMLTYFKHNVKASKEVLHILRAIKQLTYRKAFPVFSEDGDNVLVFNNIALIPAKKKALPFSANHYVRNPNHYDYDLQAKCPRWLAFLDKTFKDDKDAEQKIQFLQEFIGLSLTNNVKYQQSLMLYGAGSNGKSVILQVLSLLVGEGNVSHLSLRNFSDKFSLVKLDGKLVNIDADIEYDAMKAEGKFKSVVAGDEITVEEKYEASFSFKPVAKLWIAANVLPKVRNNSHGYYRRFIILEFNNIVPKEKQNKNLINELKEELSGILNWALEGLERLIKNDALTIPDSSKEAIKNYECENNHTKQFVEEYLEITDKYSRTKKEDIYKRFCDVLAANNYPKIDVGRFGRELKALGVEDSKSGSSRFYHVKFKNIPANDSEMETKQAA